MHGAFTDLGRLHRDVRRPRTAASVGCNPFFLPPHICFLIAQNDSTIFSTYLEYTRGSLEIGIVVCYSRSPVGFFVMRLLSDRSCTVPRTTQPATRCCITSPSLNSPAMFPLASPINQSINHMAEGGTFDERPVSCDPAFLDRIAFERLYCSFDRSVDP